MKQYSLFSFLSVSLIVSFFVGSLAQANFDEYIQEDLKEIDLTEDRKLTVNLYTPNPQSKKWIVFIPGTSTHFHFIGEDEIHDPAIQALVRRGFNLALINKPGVGKPLYFAGSSRVDYEVYESSFNATLRVQDYGAALKQAFSPDSQIYLIGHSEGAYLAPEVALNDSRVKGVVLKAGGTRPWLDEEIAKEFPGSKGLKHAVKTVKRFRKGNFLRFENWHGYPVTTLLSFDKLKAKEALEKLKIPVLAVLAQDDNMIDVKGAMEDLDSIAKLPGSRLSRVYFYRGGHGIGGASGIHAVHHLYNFILSADYGIRPNIPGGVKSCNFAFDHKLLSLQ